MEATKILIKTSVTLQASSKETQLFWTHFSRWPWATDPDPGSCTFCQMVLRALAKWNTLQLHWSLSIYATFHAAFLLKKSTGVNFRSVFYRDRLIFHTCTNTWVLGTPCTHATCVGRPWRREIKSSNKNELNFFLLLHGMNAKLKTMKTPMVRVVSCILTLNPFPIMPWRRNATWQNISWHWWSIPDSMINPQIFWPVDLDL